MYHLRIEISRLILTQIWQRKRAYKHHFWRKELRLNQNDRDNHWHVLLRILNDCFLHWQETQYGRQVSSCKF
jgi:hypothetical protein